MIEDWFSYAQKIAKRSPDPSTKVGAVVVSEEYDAAVGVGWNDFPPGIPKEWWEDRARKYRAVVHAEAWAFLSSNPQYIPGSTLYVTQHPCPDCAKLIARSGVRRVVCPNGAWRDDPTIHVAIEEASEILRMSGVEMVYKENGK